MNTHTNSYSHTQRGTLILVVVTLAMIGAIWSLELFASDFAFTAMMFALLAVLAALFSSMTVSVDDSQLTWCFGFGFWRKTLSLALIESVEVVRNKPWWGWGIRYYGNGWLYNVSGLDAVELRTDRGRAVRLGTGEPIALRDAILARLSSN